MLFDLLRCSDVPVVVAAVVKFAYVATVVDAATIAATVAAAAICAAE